jgi:hypothetical protein
MKSSYDKRMVLADVIGPRRAEPRLEEERALAAAGMPSDYDRGQVLTAYVQNYGVEPPLREPFFAAVRIAPFGLRGAGACSPSLRKRAPSDATSSSRRSSWSR